MSIDRYINVLHRDHYEQFLSWGKVFIAAVWILTLAFACVSFGWHDFATLVTYCALKVYPPGYKILIVLLWVFVGIGMVYLNVRVLHAIKAEYRMLVGEDGSQSHDVNIPDILQNKMAATKVVVIVLGVFMGCWLLLMIVLILDCFDDVRTDDHIELNIGLFLAFANSGLNFIVYFVRSPDFKEEFMRIICKKNISSTPKGDQHELSGDNINHPNGHIRI
jgi:hypothetical protein